MKRPVKPTSKASVKPAAKSKPVAAPTADADRSLGGRIVTAPQLRSPADARKRLNGWLTDIGKGRRKAAAKTLNELLRSKPKVRDLMLGLAEGSPYLWDLAGGDARRLAGLLEADPDQRLQLLCQEMSQGVAAAVDEAGAMQVLRRVKAEAALMIALADIGGVWNVERVTRALTQVADTAVRAAVRFLLSAAVRDGALRPEDPTRPEDGSGYVVLAMGKMGAGELNYSSDIDVIVFYDPEAPAIAPGHEPAPLYIRVTRGLVRLLQERTADGYVFRVDLRLRPDPASTQIAISRLAALDYYESVGQNWERAAMIKARAAAGDLVAGRAILRDLAPFVWRKYLDFAAVADVHAMKRQIHAYRGHEEIAIEGHNIKLGRGGIREIEFFVQTQQLIAGGRHPQLRGRETLAMLSALASGGWIKPEAAQELTDAYRFLRDVEHRLQMVADEQTHTLPSDKEALENFVRFLGFENRQAFADVFLDHLRKVQRNYAQLFEHMPPLIAVSRRLEFSKQDIDRGTLDTLAQLGFKQPVEASATVQRWLSGTYPSLRGEFARSHLGELVPVFIDHLVRSKNPDAGLVALDRFLSGLQGGARFYSTLRRNPDFVALLATLLGTAPRLAEILSRQPEVMDALLDPTFFGALPGEAELTRALVRLLDESRTYEDFLDRLRTFGHEHMFLIGARILSGTVSSGQAGEAFARLADILLRAVHQTVEVHFASQYGLIKGQEAAVLAMGKLGGREMTAGSDLDLIVIYDYDWKHPESDGERRLPAGQYFARLTQRLISAITAQTNYGKLYDVDMRLRPSGRSGPVATSIEAFESYQEQEAWTWEHLALTRARVVSSSPAFAARVEKVISTVLSRPRDAKIIAEDVVAMREAIAKEKGDDEVWDLKNVAGGLIDLEFIAQFLQLVHAAKHPDILDTSTLRVLEKAARAGVLSARDAEVLRPAALLYHPLTQILRLCLSGPFDPKTAGAGLLQLLTRAADVPDFATLEAHLTDTQTRVRACFNRILAKTK